MGVFGRNIAKSSLSLLKLDSEVEMSANTSRVNFFTGRLLSIADLRDEQEYQRQKMKRHNRFLHGSGVVYGLELAVDQNSVIVQPGLALDCAGNEIDLQVKQVAALPKDAQTLYVVIAYREYGEAMVPVVGVPSNVAGESSQPLRIVEGYEVSFAAEMPKCSVTGSEGQPLTCGQAHPVVLGQVVCRRGGCQLNRSFRRPAISHLVKK